MGTLERYWCEQCREYHTPTYRGVWAPDRNYVVGDIVWDANPPDANKGNREGPSFFRANGCFKTSEMEPRYWQYFPETQPWSPISGISFVVDRYYFSDGRTPWGLAFEFGIAVDCLPSQVLDDYAYQEIGVSVGEWCGRLALPEAPYPRPKDE